MSIRNGLLALLSGGPMYGYQLRAEFEANTGSTWPLNIGQVYSTIQRLERDGLVVASDTGDPSDGPGDDRRHYAITDAGLDDLHQWFRTAVERSAGTRSELVIKVAMAASLPGVDVQNVIDVQRAASMQTLQEYTRAKAATGDNTTASLVADSVIFNVEAEIRWLDHCEARLGGRKREGAAR